MRSIHTLRRTKQSCKKNCRASTFLALVQNGFFFMKSSKVELIIRQVQLQ